MRRLTEGFHSFMATLAFGLFLWGVFVQPMWLNPEPAEVRTTCVEDMSCWDCRTMGNHICGINGSGQP